MEKKQTAMKLVYDKIAPYLTNGKELLAVDVLAVIQEIGIPLEREQIEEAVKICVLEDRKLLKQSNCFCVPFLPKPKKASEYYTQTFKP